jgi:hypothetical protein
MAMGTVRYKRTRKKKEFDLLWGILMRAQWGDPDGFGLKVILVPIVR